MQQYIRALALMSMVLTLALGCSRTTHGQRVSQAPPRSPTGASAPTQAAPPTVASAPTEALSPIPGHPPVTMSGEVASVDPATGILTFKDGRMVMVTDRSKVLQPVDTRAVRPGEQVIVRDALPVGVQPAAAVSGAGTERAMRRKGQREHMGTVARVDEQNQNVWLMDGTGIHVMPSTQMHMGTAGQTIVLADLRPGDELVVVLEDEGPMPTAQGAATTGATAGGGTAAAPSALARQATAATPRNASEMMVFRNVQAP
jgi:hypothetical protein